MWVEEEKYMQYWHINNALPAGLLDKIQKNAVVRKLGDHVTSRHSTRIPTSSFHSLLSLRVDLGL